MIKQTAVPKNVDDYIATFPATTQKVLNKLRQTIRKTAPAAEETISYGMPAYKLHGPLVYFGGYKTHIGFYPTGSGIKNFEGRLSPYKWSKGTIQFSLDRPLPLDLVAEIVKFRVQENTEKAGQKKA